MTSETAPIVLNDRWVRIAAIPIVGFLVPILFFDKTLEGGLEKYWRIWLIAMIYTGIYYEGNRFFFVQVHRRFPFLAQTPKRIAWLAFCSLTYTTLVCSLLDTKIKRLFHLDSAHTVTISVVENYMASVIPVIIF